VSSRRIQIALVVLAVVAGMALAVQRHHAPGRQSSTLEAAASSPSDRARALAILRGWDRQRAAAYAAGDAAALRRLYVAGSRSGRNDRRLLREYAGRGLRVVEMRTQILSVDIREHTGDALRLAVTDRLASAVAVGEGVRTELPRDAATPRVVELRRAGPRWLVVEVETVAQPSAAAITSLKPGS
jgi:hypothetical protein